MNDDAQYLVAARKEEGINMAGTDVGISHVFDGPKSVRLPKDICASWINRILRQTPDPRIGERARSDSRTPDFS